MLLLDCITNSQFACFWWDIAIIYLFTLFCYHTKCDRFLASRILYWLYITMHTNKQKIRKEEKRWFGSLLYTAISIIFTYIINSSTNVYYKRQSYSMPSQMVRFCIRFYMIEKIQQSSHHENKWLMNKISMLNCYLEIKTDPVMLFKAILYNSSQFLQRITDVILLHQKSINSTYEYFAKIETSLDICSPTIL